MPPFLLPRWTGSHVHIPKMHWFAEPSESPGSWRWRDSVKQGCLRLCNALKCISEAILTIMHALSVMDYQSCMRYQSCMHFYMVVNTTDFKAVLVLLVHYFIWLLSALHGALSKGVSAILCCTSFIICLASIEAHTKWQPQTHARVQWWASRQANILLCSKGNHTKCVLAAKHRELRNTARTTDQDESESVLHVQTEDSIVAKLNVTNIATQS